MKKMFNKDNLKLWGWTTLGMIIVTTAWFIDGTKTGKQNAIDILKNNDCTVLGSDGGIIDLDTIIK